MGGDTICPVSGAAGDERGAGPLHVLLYSDSAAMSGAEAVFLDLARSLAVAPEIRLTVAVAEANERLREEIWAITGVPLVPVAAHPDRLAPVHLADPVRGMRLRRLVRGLAVDAVIANLPGPDFGAVPLIWTAGTGVATLAILHLHQTISSCPVPRPAPRARDAAIARILRRADHVWAISPVGAGEMIRDWGLSPERAGVLPLMPRTPRWIARDQARAQLGLDSDAELVGIVGRVEIGQKGHDTLVAAAAMLVRERPRLQVVVAGDGPDFLAVRQLVAAAGLDARFRFIGPVTPPDPVYAGLDAIVMPSRFEGLPLVALEALGTELPGVASDVDGLGVVWPGEWTVRPGDPVVLASRLSGLLALEPPARAEIMRAANRRAGAYLSENPAAAIVPVLLEVTARRRRR